MDVLRRTVRLGQRAQLPPLVSPDGFERTTESRGPAGRDLAEHDLAAPGQHQVELADGTLPVASEQPVSPLPVALPSGFLAVVPDAVAHTQSMEAGADTPR